MKGQTFPRTLNQLTPIGKYSFLQRTKERKMRRSIRAYDHPKSDGMASARELKLKVIQLSGIHRKGTARQHRCDSLLGRTSPCENQHQASQLPSMIPFIKRAGL